LIVAIDGPAASGKGTLARRIAAHLGLAYLDTGLLYRAVGLAVLRAGRRAEDAAAAVAAARGITLGALEEPALRGDEAGNAASKVAAIPAVREALFALQRRFAHHPPGGAKGAVLDGRDIGTIICPEAAVKLFITASPEVRAARRLKELRARGADSIYARVLQDLRERDARDAARAVAPLKPAADALVIDTSGLDAEQAFAAALDYINSRAARSSG
jgi:cytidylate kinase